MKYTITIEETNVKDFEIEAESAEEAYEIAEQSYKSGEFILDPTKSQGVHRPMNRLVGLGYGR